MESRYLQLYLVNIQTSDEMFIPTLLLNSDTFKHTATCDTTLHFTHWIRPGIYVYFDCVYFDYVYFNVSVVFIRVYDYYISYI